MKSTITRDNILDAADRLFYRQGYESTSFADIADEVRISRGNFYYHFKSKDEILGAVIEARLSDTREMLRQWEAESDDPADRIRSFIRIVIVNGTDIERFGCPVGTLNAELAKLNHGAKDNAVALFELFRSWLSEQFEALGRGDSADDLAMHVLAFSQGVASLSNAFRDRVFVEREVDRMCRWLDEVLAERP